MFSLALGTTAAWMVFDAAWFARRETAEYRQWARRFSLKLYTAAIVCFAVVGSWYAFLTWTPGVRKAMFAWPWLPLTLATAVAMGLPWLLIYRTQKRAEIGRGLASLLGLVQFLVLGVNAVSRQVVQNLELARYSFDITKQPEAVQWSPLIFFLVVLRARPGGGRLDDRPGGKAAGGAARGVSGAGPDICFTPQAHRLRPVGTAFERTSPFRLQFPPDAAGGLGGGSQRFVAGRSRRGIGWHGASRAQRGVGGRYVGPGRRCFCPTVPRRQPNSISSQNAPM